jgi:hypothetical protein
MAPFAEVSSGQLAEVVWVSLVAGVATSTVFSLVIRWGASYDAARREGRDVAAVIYAGLWVLGLAAFLGGVVLGVHIMLSK